MCKRTVYRQKTPKPRMTWESVYLPYREKKEKFLLLQLLVAVLCSAAELFLNADELVVLSHTVGTRE